MSGVRTRLFMAWFFGLSAAFAVAGLPLLLLPRAILTQAQRLWARLALAGLRWICGVRVEVRGAPPPGAALIAAKHQSMLDGIAPLVFLRDPSFVLKQELMRIPVAGAFGRKAELIALDRAGQARALKQLTVDVADRMAKSRPVVIFPEGTRRPPGGAPDYKPGVAGLYRELAVAVTPLATNSGLCWPAHGPIRPGVAVYAFLDSIPPGLRRAAFMQTLQARIEPAADALLRAPRPAADRPGA